jgi:hypothetical protein
MKSVAPAVVGAVLLVLAIALAIQQSVRTMPTASASAAKTARPSHPSTASPAHEATAASQRSAAVGEPAKARALLPGEIEICGLGRAMADTEAARELERRANEYQAQIAEAHLDRMRHSADDKTRAAAMMARREAAPLIDLALRTHDPTIYSMALEVCETPAVIEGHGQACQMVSAEQMARFDPDNLATWLAVAAAAEQRGEMGNVAAAMHRASLSRSARLHSDAFFGLALDAIHVDAPATERMNILVAAIGIQAAFAVPQYQAASRRCSVQAMQDMNLRQTCAAIADLMVTRGRSMLELAIARGIGERAGWPADRVDLIRAKIDAYQRALLNRLDSSPGGPVGCQAMRFAETWWRAVSEHGEVRAAEMLFATDLPSNAVLLERWRASQEVRRRAIEAATAASAGSSPPR